MVSFVLTFHDKSIIFTQNFQIVTTISFLCIIFGFIACVWVSGGYLLPLSAKSREGGKFVVGQETFFIAGVRKTILTCDLLHTSQIQTWFPVRLPVMQGTIWKISTDHMGVQTCNCDWNTTVNQDLHMQNRCLHFFFH